MFPEICSSVFMTASIVIWDHLYFTSYSVFLFSVLIQMWNAAPISGFPSQILISHKAIMNSRYNSWDRKMKGVNMFASTQKPWNGLDPMELDIWL